MFNLFKKKSPVVEPPKEPKPKKPRQPRPKPQVKELSAKEIATQKGEPYINIIGMDIDPNNIGIGAFELDWNEFFIAKLIKSGYKAGNEEQLVDQWFQDVCRNVVMETYEQFEANNPRPPNGIHKKDLGNGRTEVS